MYLNKAKRSLDIAVGNEKEEHTEAPSNVSGGYPSIKSVIKAEVRSGINNNNNNNNNNNRRENEENRKVAADDSTFGDDDLDVVDIEIDDQQCFDEDLEKSDDDDEDYYRVVVDNNVSIASSNNGKIGTDTTNNNGATNRNNVSARKRATKRTLNDRSSTSLNGSGLVGRVHVLRKLGSNSSNNNDDPDASLESFDHLSIDSSLNNTNMEDGNEEVQNVNDISAISDRSEDDIDDL